jgi:hypothetical protein
VLVAAGMLTAGCASAEATSVAPRAAGQAVTASSVEGLAGDLSSVRPAVRTTYRGDPLAPADYLKPMGPLGHYGLVGAWGPLGQAGPVGDAAWNPSAWISGTAWDQWASMLGWYGGPMSSWGPLGPDGPLSEEAYHQQLPSLGDFSKQTQAGGVWTPLGPIGPLGALGPLGPLGPVGAHGYRADGDGQYVSGSAVRRTYDAPYGQDTRRFELYEMYDPDFARRLGPRNDTSFGVEQRGLGVGTVQDYPFTSAADQFVTVLVVPLWMRYDLASVAACVTAAAGDHLDRPAGCAGGADLADRYTVELRDAGGRTVAVSDSSEQVNWLQVRVPAGSTLTARVGYAGRGGYVGAHGGYRLFVTGSSRYFADTDITGDHRTALGG